MKIRYPVTCAVWSLLSAIGVHAQGVDTSRVPLAVQDSVVTAVVTRALIARLAPQITKAVLSDTVPRPWEIHVPLDSNAIQWSRIQSALMRALHARPRTDTDTSYSLLTIRRSVFRRDSLIIEYDVGGRWRCGATFKGIGTMYRAASRWTQSMYNGEPLVSVVVGQGDSAPCRGAPSRALLQ